MYRTLYPVNREQLYMEMASTESLVKRNGPAKIQLIFGIVSYFIPTQRNIGFFFYWQVIKIAIPICCCLYVSFFLMNIESDTYTI